MENRQPLAIVGYAYRAPGTGRKGLWEFLSEAKSAWTRIPSDRFNAAQFYHPDAAKGGFIHSQGGHFLPDDIYAFDAGFFHVTAEEARAMDPQHRLLLEAAFEAVEHAGLRLPDLAGADVGVFCANDYSDYSAMMVDDLFATNKYTALGVCPSLSANRLSYFFGLTGPSLAVDAACAGSHYALHLACQSIWSGECAAALVGGAKLLNSPNMWSAIDTMGALSAAGRSFAYDAKAAGYGKGEGGGCVVVKPLADALANGDPVRAVLRNAVCSHSGRTPGITMPSQAAQMALLRRVHTGVGLDPTDTTLAEGHGTGTPVGDPIDASALATVLGSKSSAENPLHIGSIKSNVGHLEGASGIISIIKSIMMLEQGVMLPNAGFEKMNPKIEGGERLKVLTHPKPWRCNGPRRVCIMNAGFGGSNGAVLLEEAPSDTESKGTSATNGTTKKHQSEPPTNGDRQDDDLESATISISLNLNGSPPDEDVPNDDGSDNGPDHHAFVFSAKSLKSLKMSLSSFADHLEQTPHSARLAENICYTLGSRRTNFPQRIAVTADSLASLRDQLLSMLSNPDLQAEKKQDNPAVGYIFTGQGAQYFQMATRLRRYAVFRQAIRDAEATLRRLGAPWSLARELAAPERRSRVDSVEIAQPACTAVQVALVLLLRSWGLAPATVVGHSSGEIAAAFAAGFLSRETAVAVAYARGVAARELLAQQEAGGARGAMLALGVGGGAAAELLEGEAGRVTIAALNSPGSVTVSGDADAVERVHAKALEQGLFARKLKVGVAYHSSHMQQVADLYLESIKPFFPVDGLPSAESAAKGPLFISSVTGQVEGPETVGASYWVRNLVQPVNFLQAIETLSKLGSDQNTDGNETRIERPNVFIEVGPHPALKTSVFQCFKNMQTALQQEADITYLPSLARGQDSSKTILDLAGKIFAMGIPVDVAEANRTNEMESPAVVTLPAYEWDKSVRYIHQSRVVQEKLHGGAPYDPLIGWRSERVGGGHNFRNIISLDDMPWIRGYTGHGEPSIPSTVFLSMGIGAFKSLHPDAPSSTVMVRDACFLQSLALGADSAVDITISMRPLDDDSNVSAATSLPRPCTFEVASWSETGGWAVHCRGVVESCRDDDQLYASPRVQEALKALEDGTLEDRSPANEYAILKQHSIAYGDSSTTSMVDLKQGPGKVVHTIAVRASDKALSNTYPQQEQGSRTLATEPQTLDSFFHSFGMVQELTRRRLASVPSSLRNWKISDICLKADQNLVIVTKRLAQDRKSGTLTVSLVVFDVSGGSSPKPVAELNSLDLKTIPDPNCAHQAPCLPVTFWNKKVPCIDFVERGFLSDLITGQLPPVDDWEVRRLHELNSLSMYFMTRMWEQLEKTDADLSNLPHHLTKFLAWSKRQMAQNPLPLPRDPGAMIADFSQGNGRDQLTCRVGEQLVDIVLGKKQTLDIMSQDNLLSRYYLENTTSIRGNEAVARYVRSLIECNPDLRILEIGGGTAGTALPVLSAVGEATRGATARFHYTFTDISPSFFENARAKLKTWRDQGRLAFRKLDITQDPAAQGFEPLEAYDLVIAANVLHATPDLDATLRHVRTLVRPGGKLALVEIAKEITPFSFPFAMLPQWWLAEDRYRAVDAEMTPLVSEPTWNDALVSNGFSGVEGRVDDYPEEKDKLYTAMWSTATTAEPTEPTTTKAKSHPPVGICVASGSDVMSEAFSEHLSTALEAQLGARPQNQTLAELAAAGDKSICIIIDASPQESILSNLSEADFRALKEIWTKSAGLLWVLPEGVHPDAEMIRGFLNAARQEDSSKSLLLFDNVPLGSPEGAATTARVISQRLLSVDPALRREQEFSLVDGVIHVPRLYRAHSAQDIFALEEEADDDERKKLSPIYRAPGTLLRSDATYVITGGTGGIGRTLAAWMATQGARHIVMLGRSGASSPKVAALLRTFEGTDVRMRAIACDVGLREDVDRVVETLKDWDFPQVRGVVHGALSLRDAMLVNATYEDWVGITRPKIQGAWNLHHVFPDLDFFVALASLDGVMGNVGQTIYSGTSTFLEAFVEHRLRLGQPAASITLPVITETGIAATSKLSETIHNQLALTFDVPQVHTMVKAAIVGGPVPSASGLFGSNGRSFSFFQDAVAPETEPLDWERYWSCAAVRRPVLEETPGGGGQASPAGPGAGAKSGQRDDSPASAMERLGDKISAVTMIDRHEITPERGLAEYGLDSLVAVDLRNWIRRSFGVDLPLNIIVEATNLRSLTEDVVSRMKAQ